MIGIVFEIRGAAHENPRITDFGRADGTTSTSWSDDLSDRDDVYGFSRVDKLIGSWVWFAL